MHLKSYGCMQFAEVNLVAHVLVVTKYYIFFCGYLTMKIKYYSRFMKFSIMESCFAIFRAKNI